MVKILYEPHAPSFKRVLIMAHMGTVLRSEAAQAIAGGLVASVYVEVVPG